MSCHLFAQFPRIFVVALFWILPAVSAFCTTIQLAEIRELDTQFEKLSSEVYRKSTTIRNNTKEKVNDIKSLFRLTQKLDAGDQHLLAIKYIIKYKKLVKDNIDDDSIFFFVNILIKHNEWNTVNDLFKYIIEEGDKALVSNIKFSFVKYYISRKEWQQTLNLLTDIFDDLTIDDGHYALIMKGVTLQYLKKHREALEYYRKIPVTSNFYHYAQLNIAIVYIRQGWWSDAHRTMKNMLKVKSNLDYQEEEFVNRLYLVLGYSFLQQDYFRESRDAFRNIKLNSKYANRALLGISLAAANQGDNVGSLNVLNVLQEKKSYVLAVEESYLLLPYVYEKIGQHKTSSASYTVALNYYKKRVHELNSIINKTNTILLGSTVIKNNSIEIQNNTIDFTDRYPVSFLSNLNEIKTFKKNITNAKLSSKINLVLNKYNNMLVRMVKESLKIRKDYLQNYLNQSRYGLARLYDNSKESLTKKDE